MNVEVKLINERGRAFTKDGRKTREAYKGTLRLRQEKVEAYARFVTKVQLVKKGDGLATPLLPELLDAEVLWVEDGELRIRGTELVEGIQYNQTWEAKVVKC